MVLIVELASILLDASPRHDDVILGASEENRCA
jgi:hypothetical protein